MSNLSKQCFGFAETYKEALVKLGDRCPAGFKIVSEAAIEVIDGFHSGFVSIWNRVQSGRATDSEAGKQKKRSMP